MRFSGLLFCEYNLSRLNGLIDLNLWRSNLLTCCRSAHYNQPPRKLQTEEFLIFKHSTSSNIRDLECGQCSEWYGWLIHTLVFHFTEIVGSVRHYEYLMRMADNCSAIFHVSSLIHWLCCHNAIIMFLCVKGRMLTSCIVNAKSLKINVLVRFFTAASEMEN